jgi:DNA-binding MarR family transcriptional regulator
MTADAPTSERARRLAEEMDRSCLGVRVGRLHRHVARQFEAALRPLGLTLSQMEILAGLTVAGRPVKPSMLAERLGVERSTMSRNLTLMESRGLVATAEASAGGRSLTVAITAHGTDTLAAAHEAWSEAQAGLLAQLGAATPTTIDAWLDELA